MLQKNRGYDIISLPNMRCFDMREQIIEAIHQNKLIVILRGVEKEKLIPLCEALWRGGVRLVEVTYSATKSIPDEETAAE